MVNKNIVGKNVHFGKCDWKILEWNSTGCLLVYATPGAREFYIKWDASYRADWGGDIEWPNCELFDYLNGEFLEKTFTEEERICIRPVKECSDKQCKAFLLGWEESKTYGLHTRDYLGNDEEWFRDSSSVFESECDPLAEKYIRPAIWIDFAMIDSVLPGWHKLAELLACSIGDFVPYPDNFGAWLNKNYTEAIQTLFTVLRNSAKSAIKHFVEPLYEVLYCLARNNDATSINTMFELCADLEPEGYYSYDQTLPLGEAIETNAYEAVDALIANGANPDFASYSESSTLWYALNVDVPREMLIYLLRKGAPLEGDFLYHIWVTENDSEFAKEMFSAAICCNVDECLKYVLYQEEKLDLQNECKKKVSELVTYIKLFL